MIKDIRLVGIVIPIISTLSSSILLNFLKVVSETHVDGL